MKRLVVVLATLAASALSATPARAAAEEPPPRLASQVVCIRADFPVLGSGWKVHDAAAVWNEEQSAIRLTFAAEPGCAEVAVYRYHSESDGQCGYTSWDRKWPEAVATDTGRREAVGVDIYLNDACVGAGERYTRRVIAHELGHAMGLPHVESGRSVMCQCMSYPLLRRKLVAPVDVRDLTALYRT